MNDKVSRDIFSEIFYQIFSQVEKAERSVAQLVSEERERQRNSEMREEFARLAGTVQTVSEKINNNQSQMKQIGEKIDSLVMTSTEWSTPSSIVSCVFMA